MSISNRALPSFYRKTHCTQKQFWDKKNLYDLEICFERILSEPTKDESAVQND
jgi:hypothetical protein